ncbi:hypothetical protein [Streptomyces xanthophaeus]
MPQLLVFGRVGTGHRGGGSVCDEAFDGEARGGELVEPGLKGLTPVAVRPARVVPVPEVVWTPAEEVIVSVVVI